MTNWENESDTSAVPDALSRLQFLDLPTNVITSDAEVSGFRATADQLAEIVPGARFAVVKDAGHLSVMDNPAECAMRINAFWRSVERPQSLTTDL